MAVIRRVGADEAETYRRVRLAALLDSPFAFSSTFASESGLTDADWARRAGEGAAGVERVMFFAVEDDDVVGLAGGYRDGPGGPAGKGGPVELVSMWTAPGARRRGVGRMLVGAVVDWAGAVGADSVQLWVTRGNRPAERLYLELGFRPTGEVAPMPPDGSREEIRMMRPLQLQPVTPGT